MTKKRFFAFIAAAVLFLTSAFIPLPARCSGVTTGISLDVEPIVTIFAGIEADTSWYWSVTLEPAEAWEWDSVTWESSAPDIITVTPTGRDTARVSFTRKGGIAVVTARTIGGLSAECVIEVLEGNEIYHYRIADGEAEIALYNSSATGSAVIPDTIGGCPVTSIGDGAFRWCDGLTEISLPRTVRRIGDGAFLGSRSLNAVDLPADLRFIGQDAFRDCAGLGSILIPAGVDTIGAGAFRGCTGLLTIDVEDGNDSFGSSGNCLIDTATGELIAGCGSSVIPTDGTVTRIGAGAFWGCEGLADVSLPEGITGIGDNAFYGCKGLDSLALPGSLKTIGSWAFSDCPGLESLRIPQDVIFIGEGTLSEYTRGMSVEIDYRNPRYYIEGNCIIDSDTCRIIAGRADSVIPTNGTIYGIGDYAFAWCDSLRDMTIPSGVRTIGEGAFEGCTGLTELSIPYGVTAIGSYAFEGCTGLVNITVPDSVTSIGDWAFENCRSLRSVELPADMTSVPNGAFCYCEGLRDISIPAGISRIGYSAFTDCVALTDVFYGGTEDQAREMDIDEWGNDSLTGAEWHYMSENHHSRPGDMNGDGEVTDDDAIYLLFYTFFPDDYPLNQEADLNGDGKITDDDAIYLLFHTFFPDDYPLTNI